MTRLKILLHFATLALALSSLGCGTEPAIDQALSPVVDQFVKDGLARHVYVDASHLRAYFDSTLVYAPSAGAEVVGLCDVSTGVVHVSPEYWARASGPSREFVVYHELGHCLLHRVHTLALGPGGLPRSIMYPDTLGDTDYLTRRQALLDELFANTLPGTP